MKKSKINKVTLSNFKTYTQLSKIGTKAIIALLLLVFVGILFAAWQENVVGQAGSRSIPARQATQVIPSTQPSELKVSGVAFLQQRKESVITTGPDVSYFLVSQLYFELNANFPQTAISVMLPDNKLVVIPITKCSSGFSCTAPSQKWVTFLENGKWVTKINEKYRSDNGIADWIKLWKNPSNLKESLLFWTDVQSGSSLLRIECDEKVQSCRGVIPISMNYWATNEGNPGLEIDESGYFGNLSIKLYEHQGALCKYEDTVCVNKKIELGVTLPNNNVVGLTLSPQNNFYLKIEDLVTTKMSSSKDIFAAYNNGYIGTQQYPKGVGCTCEQYQEQFVYIPITPINVIGLLNVTNATTSVPTVPPSTTGVSTIPTVPTKTIPPIGSVQPTTPPTGGTATTPKPTTSATQPSAGTAISGGIPPICLNLTQGTYTFTQNVDGTYTLKLAEKK